jgi:molybdenum cofactor cytidylyltransferase
MTFAVIPACGHSLRMGRPKLSLPLGARTVIERVVQALQAGGIDPMVVVVGPHVPELVALAIQAGADVLALPGTTADMRATVAAGLDYLEERYHPTLADWWFLAPADHPVISPILLGELRTAADLQTHTIIIPTHQGQRGHPTLISWSLAAAVRAIPPGRGINTLLREHLGETLEVEVADPGILANLDTPEDYARLVAPAMKNPKGC